ncbi:sensor histidine kinase [Streptomyces sp. CA-249302]|uniref:sensor histidine kinase n=1 Tax=Streptomyces sp. CA-249302 TaxID=3240058 RepID=UPI003D8EAA50
MGAAEVGDGGAVFGRIKGWQRRHWRDLSKAQRVEMQSVVTWYFTTWSFSLFWLALPLVGELHRRPAALVVGGLLLLVAALQCVEANRLTRPVLDHYLGRAELPPRALRPATALLALALTLALVLAMLGGTDEFTARLAVGAVLLPFGLLYGLVAPMGLFLRRSALLTVALMAAFAVVDPDPAGIAMAGVVAGFSALISLLTGRCGAWTLSVLWDAERSREVQARLAVAEERLRFGRDLHDVMGRNLAVIALKSELAVQLARRGRPEAVDQMIEVQRIAQESQREVREVVRGYREADLGVELAGAQGVLSAAGIRCGVTGEVGGLAGEVQSVLGWVVREATTNVLRHGDAVQCDISLHVHQNRVVLTVENDGATNPVGGAGSEAADPPGDTGSGPVAGAGSGLAGLRERLSAVGGSLEAGPVGADVFRVTAEVPLSVREVTA